MTLLADPVRLLQTLHATITGVQSAPLTLDDYPPGDLPSADMPLVLTWPESGDFWRDNQAPFYHRGIYTVECYVVPVGQGEGFGPNKARCQTMLAAFIATYLAEANMILDYGPTAIELIPEEGRMSHGGVTDTLEYTEGKPCHGFRIRLTVDERWEKGVCV